MPVVTIVLLQGCHKELEAQDFPWLQGTLRSDTVMPMKMSLKNKLHVL